MTAPTFTREVRFLAAYDKRDPDPRKNYGIHGVHIWFTLRNPAAGDGLTFSISTNWQLPHVQAETDARRDDRFPYLFHKPQAFGVDYHGTKPSFDGHTPHPNCEVTGAVCYPNGSGLLGDDFLQTLIAGGDEALWARMEAQYLAWRQE